MSIWHDKWMDKGSLRSQIVGPLNREKDGILLRGVVNYAGWNWQNFSFSLPNSLMQEIKATPISFAALRADRII